MLLDSILFFSLTILAIAGILCISFLTITHYYAIVRAKGASMMPSINDGEICLIKQRNFKIKVGSIYLFKVKNYGYTIKRLKSIQTAIYNGNKSYFVVGDNLEDSEDSRDFGYLPENSVIGKVIKLKFWRK